MTIPILTTSPVSPNTPIWIQSPNITMTPGIVTSAVNMATITSPFDIPSIGNQFISQVPAFQPNYASNMAHSVGQQVVRGSLGNDPAVIDYQQESPLMTNHSMSSQNHFSSSDPNDSWPQSVNNELMNNLKEHRPYRRVEIDCNYRVIVEYETVQPLHQRRIICEQLKGDKNRRRERKKGRNARNEKVEWNERDLQRELKKRLNHNQEMHRQVMFEDEEGQRVLVVHTKLHQATNRANIRNANHDEKKDIDDDKANRQKTFLFAVCIQSRNYRKDEFTFMTLVDGDALLDALDFMFPPMKFPFINSPENNQDSSAGSFDTGVLVQKCVQTFNTMIRGDTALCFQYYKESVQMALFRGNIQRHWVNELNQNGQSLSREMIEVVLLNIDLTESGSNKPLYLVTKRNDHKQKKTRQNTPWKIDCFLTEEQIHHRFGIDHDELPPSSRDEVLLSQLECVPNADILKKQGVDEMVDINWKNVKDKSTKRMKCGVEDCKCQQFQFGHRWNGKCQNPKCGHPAAQHGNGVTKEMASAVQKRKISASVLKEDVKRALLNPDTMKIPVVVNKDERSLIEWKLIVKVDA